MITFNDLFFLTKDDLIEMNIPIGPRNRILNFASMYKKHTRKYDMNELIEFFNEHEELNVCCDNNDTNSNNSNGCGSNVNSAKHKCLNISLKSNTSSMSLSKTTSANTTNCNSLCNNNNNNNNNDTNSKHNSQIVRNFESLFSEVECFQQQYEHMKVKSTERNNKINKLLLKKNGNGIIKDKSGSSKVDCSVLGNEKERDLNVELGKIYNGYYKQQHKSSRIKSNKVVFVDKYCEH